MKNKSTFLFILLMFCISCSQGQSKTYSLLTDNPQLALVGDLYNTLHPTSPPIVVSYIPNITFSELNKRNFDLIIGRNLSRFTPYFRNIEFLTRFLPFEYQEVLLKHQNSFATERMVPLSFSLPIILSPAKNNFPLFLSLEKLILPDKQELPKDSPFLAFTPFLQKPFLWYWSTLAEIDWRQSSVSDLSWNENELQAFLTELEPWFQEDFYKEQLTFLEKYGYLGERNLLGRGYMHATFSSLDHWINYESKGETFNFSFLKGKGNLVALQEDTTYLSLSLSSHPDESLQNFMRWITSFEGQKRIVQLLKQKSPYHYGFLNGFSFLESVNLTVIQEEYPFLAGKLPDLAHLEISQTLPFPLSLFIDNTWYPWLEKRMRTPQTAIPLHKAIEEERHTLYASV